MRDAAMDPHRGDVVGPGLVEVAPGDAAVLMKHPVERRTGRRGADAPGRVARHLGPGYLPTCRDIRALCRVTREVRQQPRRHRVRDLPNLHVIVGYAWIAEEAPRDGEREDWADRDNHVELRNRRVAD